MPDTTPVLVRIVALVPVRGLEAAKSRLGEALDAEERRVLVERLLARTIAAAAATPDVIGVAVVSPDPEALAFAAARGAATVPEAGDGLNAGLTAGRVRAEEAGADALLVVPADLPAVTAADLAAVVAAGRGAAAGAAAGSPAPRPARPVVVLVTDRAGDGTNVLLVAPPSAIPFCFGPGSRAAHAAAARAAGAAYVEVAGPLALDLDTPDDLLAAEALGLGTVRAETP